MSRGLLFWLSLVDHKDWYLLPILSNAFPNSIVLKLFPIWAPFHHPLTFFFFFLNLILPQSCQETFSLPFVTSEGHHFLPLCCVLYPGSQFQSYMSTPDRWIFLKCSLVKSFHGGGWRQLRAKKIPSGPSIAEEPNGILFLWKNYLDFSILFTSI